MDKITQTWIEQFQTYCDSDEIREESSLNGINACGYGIQCDYCCDSSIPYACATSMLSYTSDKNIQVNLNDVSIESFRKLLKGK